MSWKKNSIIGFDDPQLIDSLGTENRKEIEEIFGLFQNIDTIECYKNTDKYEYYDFLDIKKPLEEIVDISENYSYLFDNKDEYNFTDDIIDHHSNLLSSQYNFSSQEIMDVIIKKILITSQIFSDKSGINTGIILLNYIRYLISIIINTLRKNPYIADDINNIDDQLVEISNYFEEKGGVISRKIKEINENKAEEEYLQGQEHKDDQLKKIYQQRNSHTQYANDIYDYYVICTQQYAILMKSMIVSGDVYLPGLYNKLYDLIFIKSAIDIINSCENDNYEE